MQIKMKTSKSHDSFDDLTFTHYEVIWMQQKTRGGEVRENNRRKKVAKNDKDPIDWCLIYFFFSRYR